MPPPVFVEGRAMQVTVPEALAAVLSGATPLPAEDLPLDAALGAVLARDVVSGEDVPPFTNSAMDGFALRAADLAGASAAQPAVLQVVDEVAAGTVGRVPVGPGLAVRIMTGAPIPPGADTVVPFERTVEAGQGQVGVPVALKRGANVRAAGEDVRAGSTVLAAGAVLSPATLGVLASVGVARVPVHRRPVVAVVTTGDELVDAAERPGPGQIRDSNLPGVMAAVRAAGGVPLAFPRTPDRREAVAEVLARALAAADLVVSSGGVSAGDHDHVNEVLTALGGRPRFLTVRQRPGHPLAFWEIGGKPFFGLPGNPVSTLLCFEVYVRPRLRRMLGHRHLWRPEQPAVLPEGFRKSRDDARMHFVRVALAVGPSGLEARVAGSQGSGVLTTLLRTGGLALVGPETAALPPGATVTVQRLDLPEDH
ncbi:MAG: gephyrin-like molybdotransferase Glp [Pseudomonadota bacterium]